MATLTELSVQLALTANHEPPWCHQNARQCWLALWCRGKIIKVMLVIYIGIKKWWALPIDQFWWNVWWKASGSQWSALIFPQAHTWFCEWHMVRFRLLCKKNKIKWVTPLGKAVWRLSSLMALPLAEILYHHTPQPPYLLPGRLVLLSISSLAPKCPSIICHAIFFFHCFNFWASLSVSFALAHSHSLTFPCFHPPKVSTFLNSGY